MTEIALHVKRTLVFGTWADKFTVIYSNRGTWCQDQILKGCLFLKEDHTLDAADCDNDSAHEVDFKNSFTACSVRPCHIWFSISRVLKIAKTHPFPKGNPGTATQPTLRSPSGTYPEKLKGYGRNFFSIKK